MLVTGAGGFIGSHLVEALAAAGARVRALVHYNALGSAGWLDEIDTRVRSEVEIRRGDIADPGYVDDLVTEQEIVLHLAALIAIPHSYVAPQSFVDVNVRGTLNLLEACRRRGVARMVHTSTSEVYGTAITTPITEAHPLQPQSPYSASKIGADALAEAFARSFEMPVVILRPFNTYGPRQSERAVIPTVIRQALDPACETVRIGDLAPQRDFNYVGDTVAAFVAAATSDGLEPGGVYNTGTGVAVSVGDIVDRVFALTGTRKPVEVETTRYRPPRSEVHLLLADAGRFSTASGWQPQIALDDGLAATIDWWRTRFASGAVRPNADYAT